MAKPQTELQAGLQGVLNQLPSLLLNYRLQQDAQIKSLSTKSAENILANSANYTSQDQFTNSRDHINNMFNSHAGDPAMQAVKLTALEALSNTENSFIHREDASSDLALLNRKASKFIGQLRTEDMGKVINDMTSVLDENKTYMDRSTFKSAKSQLDDYIEWYTVAKPVMASDTDPEEFGLQADENIMRAGTLLSMNRTDEAVKWYMKSGVSTANTAKDQIKTAVGSSLRVNIRGMNGLNTANAETKYTNAVIHDIQLPAMGDIDAASVPMYKDMFQDNVDNILLKSGWEQPMMVEGNDTPYDETANGMIEYLKDSGVWGNMEASVKLLEKKIDFPGWGTQNKENTYSARHFLFQLDALDKLDQAELMIGNVNKTSKSSIQGTISSILNSDEEADEIAKAKSIVATTPITSSELAGGPIPGVIQTGPNSYKSTAQKVIEDPLVQAINDIERRQREEALLAKQQQSTLMDVDPLNTDPPPVLTPSIHEQAQALAALDSIDKSSIRRPKPTKYNSPAKTVGLSAGIPDQAVPKMPKKDRGESNREYIDSLNLDGESEFAATIKEVYQETESQESASLKSELSALYEERLSIQEDQPSAERFGGVRYDQKIKALNKKISKLEAQQGKILDIQGLSSDEQIDTIILEMFNNQGDYLPKGMKKFKSLNKFLDYLNKAQEVKPGKVVDRYQEIYEPIGGENQGYWPEEGY